MRIIVKLLGVVLLMAAFAAAYACESTTGNTAATSQPASTTALPADDSTSNSVAPPGSTSAPRSTAVADSTTLPSRTNETAGGDVGSARDNPVPLGQEAQVGDWTVKVLSATLNADDLVVSQNEFNNPPAAENQYVLVKVEATRTGEGPVAFLPDIYCTFVGSGGTTFEMALADVPESIAKTAKVSKGGSVTGNLVFEVASDQVPGGVAMMEYALSFQVTRLYFALR